MAERCELSDLDPSACAHCRKLPDPFAVPNTTRIGDGTAGPRITARYGGKCACGSDFRPGDTIRADGLGGYLAIACCDDLDGTGGGRD